MQNLTTFDTNKYLPYTVGFDNLFQRLFDLDLSTTGYPHYDIIKTSETNYKIEMALAGFNKDNIDIELQDGTLTVKSKTTEHNKKNNNFIHKGISERSFLRKFTLSEEINVKSAEMNDGILSIFLERIIPEHKKAQTIKIK